MNTVSMKRDGDFIFQSLNCLNNSLWQPQKKNSLKFFLASMPSAFFLYKFFHMLWYLKR